MQAILTRNLFRRPQPTNEVAAQGFLDKNSVIDIVETVEGQKIDGISIWHKAADGFFYWGGGVEIFTAVSITAAPESISAEFDPVKMSWAHQFLEIPFIWNDIKTKGKDVTVAVIDTGIDDSHIDLAGSVHPLSKSFIDGESIFDINGHGTSMAGIICGNGTKVFGVAPEAKLLVLRATRQKNEANIDGFTKAVNFATSLAEVDIISISYSFVIDSPDFRRAINTAIAANKIVVSAMGNGHNLLNTDQPDIDTFPACYNNDFPEKKGILGIGAFNQGGNLCKFSSWSKHLRCIAPGQDILTTKISNSSGNETGTSIATAYIAGCLALMISYQKMNPSNKNCVEILLDSCDDLGPQIGFDIRNGFGKINLRNAVSKLK
jgi:major intracellular serine protease